MSSYFRPTTESGETFTSQDIACGFVLLRRIYSPRALCSTILFDEPTSALDVSVQADIPNLISEQVRQTNAAAVFVTHDLAVVRQIADRALVLLHGKVVETGSVEDVLERPQHHYTKQLLAAFSAKGENAPAQ